MMAPTLLNTFAVETIQTRARVTCGRKGLLIIALAFGLVATAVPGEGLPISAFTGNDPATPTSLGLDGTVNFAVFRGDDFKTAAGPTILSLFMPGIGSLGLADADLTQDIHVYLYQITNDGTNPTTIRSFSTGRSPSADVIRWGHFGGVVFREAGVNVGFGNSLDVEGSNPPIDFSPGSVTNPSRVTMGSTSIVAQFSSQVPDGGTTSIIAYTSHFAPDWFPSQLASGVSGAGACTPGAGVAALADCGAGVAVPEPGTLLLMAMGLVGLGALRRNLYRRGRDR